MFTGLERAFQNAGSTVAHSHVRPMAMTQSIEGKRIGILGAVALMLTVLVIASPVAANPVQPGSIVLTSTSGRYWALGGPTSLTGPAAGTMTITPIANAASVYNAKVTAGAVSLGTATYSITGGSAVVTRWFIRGVGTVEGGTFTFTAFSVGPTALGNPYSYTILTMQIHVGGNSYLVLLHVTTTIVPADHAAAPSPFFRTQPQAEDLVPSRAGPKPPETCSLLSPA